MQAVRPLWRRPGWVCDTLLFNINLDSVALMPCNPAIGGLAKGQLVKEIDALGGEMGHIADRTAVHFRLLNASKGPASVSSRFQCDKQLYRLAMKTVVEREKRVHLRQSLVTALRVEGNRVDRRRGPGRRDIRQPRRVVATGTFLNGLHPHRRRPLSSRAAGEIASLELAECVKSHGFETGG